MATKQVSDAIAPGEIVSVEKCAVVEIGNRDDDVVVKFDSSPFEYCLPGSAIRRIPPAQAEPVAAERINANNPSTVPERFRQCMIDAAEYIVPRAMNTPGAGYTTKEGVLQMLTDLLALSLNDGCIAAAWAFEQIVQSVPAKPALTSLPNWPPGAVADITAALDAELEQKVEAKEPWKPRFDDSPLNRPWDCEICECGCHHGEADDEFDDDTSCYHCGGKRYVITCPDDLCATSDSCMHGDGEEDCPVCNADGDYEWNC